MPIDPGRCCGRGRRATLNRGDPATSRSRCSDRGDPCRRPSASGSRSALDGIAPCAGADLDELRRPDRRPAAGAAAASEPPPVAALVLDSSRSSARCGDREIDLTRLEHDLLTCLITEPARVWSYAELHRSVWGDEGRERKADVQSLVKRLRRKLHDLGTGATIDVVRGVGLG